MKRIIGWLLLFALAASGCVEPAPAADPEAGPEACLADQLVRPLISSPANEIISSLLPTLTWAYPDGCVPETFRVEVQDYEESTLYDQDLPGSQSSWDTTTPLQPASIYRWRVAAVQGGSVGPYSGWTAFWTGPLCESAQWQAPELISPVQGETVTTASPELRWQYASDGCLTAESRFEVSESEDFSALALFGQGGPEPRFLTGLSYLQDCKNYYWRVAPWKDGQIGPFAAPV